MATTKPPRSPRRAQLHSTSTKRGRPMKYPAGRLPVYEALFAFNQGFEQVLVHFERLRELGMFQKRELENIFRVFLRSTRAWVNMKVVETLQPRERDDWTHLSQLHNDTLMEAKLLLAKMRRKAAGKKGQRKRRRAKSE